MRIWRNRGWLALLGFLVLIIIGVLVLVVNHRSAMRALQAEHDEGIKRIGEYLSNEPLRPVLRGEALPGNGGPKLAKVLTVIGSERPKPPWRLLLRDAKGILDPGSKPEVADAYAYGVKFLPSVREAIQHDYCRLCLDYAEMPWSQYLPQASFLIGIFLQEAQDFAGRGQFETAVRDVSDAIRLSHDLGRRTGPFPWPAMSYGQRAGVELSARLLFEHPFPTEVLEDWVEEVRGLRSTIPLDMQGSVLEEYSPLIQLHRGYWWPSMQSRNLVAKAEFSILLLYTGGLHLEEYHARFEDFRRIQNLDLSQVEAEIPAYRERAPKTRQFLLGPVDPIRAKEINLIYEMELACLEAGLLAHICRSMNDGAWPKTLSECGDIPLDPWDGKPLRYKPPANGKPAFVYSIGKNRKDDGGLADTPFLGRLGKNADYVFPLGPWPKPKQMKPKTH